MGREFGPYSKTWPWNVECFFENLTILRKSRDCAFLFPSNCRGSPPWPKLHQREIRIRNLFFRLHLLLLNLILTRKSTECDKKIKKWYVERVFLTIRLFCEKV